MVTSLKKFFSDGIKWNIIFLLSVLFTVFCVTIFPAYLQKFLYDISFSVIFILGYITSDRKHPAILPLAIASVVMLWISAYFEMKMVFIFSYAMNIIFFISVIVSMIKHLVHSAEVNARLILEAVIIYLIIGLIFSMVVSLIDHFDPGAFTFAHYENVVQAYHLNDFIYFTFVTLTTTGFGDITPVQPYARSLTILIAITGQMYIAIIISMLVGKYAASRLNDRFEE
jgi:voltage-gated potassium channel